MEKSNFTKEDYSQILSVVENVNTRHLNKILGIKAIKSRTETIGGASPHQEVAPSTPRAQDLLDLFRSSLLQLGGTYTEGGNDDECLLGADDILQALLMIDPSYKTPWESIDVFVSSIRDLSGSSFFIMHGASLIEDFFLRANFQFHSSKLRLGEKQIPHYVRDMIVKFGTKLSDHFYSGADITDEATRSTNQDDRNETGRQTFLYCTLTLEMMHSILAVCKDWCTDLFDAVVSVAYLRDSRIVRIRPWLELLQVTLDLLTNSQVERLSRILVGELEGHRLESVIIEDFLASIKLIFEISSRCRIRSFSKDEDSHQMGTLWRKVSDHALYHACQTLSCESYQKCEHYLENEIVKWDNDSLKRWIFEMLNKESSSTISRDATIIPSWFTLNLVSLCMKVLRAKDSRSDLTDITMGNNLNGDSLETAVMRQEYELILNYVLGDQDTCILDRASDGMFYELGGSFHVEDEDAVLVDWLSKCAALLIKTFGFRGNEGSETLENEPINQTFVLSRVLHIIELADEVSNKSTTPRDSQRGIFFAMIANTVAYFETPEFRPILENRIKRATTRPSEFQIYYQHTIRLILSSASRMNDTESVLDVWIEIIDASCHYSSGINPNRIVTNLHVPKLRVLNRSKVLLLPFYSSWGEHRHEKPFETGNTWRKRCIVGILGLLELVSGDDWGEIEKKAWKIFSDTLVLDVPPLPAESREWLFQVLITSVADGLFSSKTLDHLLRATAIRIGFLVSTWTTQVLDSRDISELSCLHRLMTMLFRCLTSEENFDEERQILLAQGREDLLRSILSYKRGQSPQNYLCDGIVRKLNSRRANEYDSFALSWLLFLTVNSNLLDKIMTETSSSEVFQSSLDTFADKIKSLEVRELGETDEIHSLPNIFSSWSNKALQGSSTSLGKSSNRSPRFDNCISDLLLEFLFLVPLPPRGFQNFNDPLSWKVVVATGFLTSQKRLSLVDGDPALGVTTIDRIGGHFFSIVAHLIREAIRRDCGLSALEDMLGPTVSFCRAVNLTLETNQNRMSIRMIDSLWSLYQTIASEKSCVRIISYLESHISENHDVTVRRKPGVFSLRFLYSDSDVDETVQELRLSCLRPFRKCLATLDTAGVNSEISWSQVSNILAELVGDLKSGLDGKSGGIPPELYISYCEAIDECASFLFNQTDPSSRYAVFLQFEEVTRSLSNILVAIPLRDAKLFKTTFIFAFAIFPSMCRDLVRRSLSYSDLSAPVIDYGLAMDSKLLDQVREDCIVILNRWGVLREPNLIPWLDIAGPDHSETEIGEHTDMNDHNQSRHVSSDSTPSYDGEVPRIVHVLSPSRNNRHELIHHDKHPRRIRLYSKEVWSWTLSCSLLGMEQNWLNSERSIQVLDTEKTPSSCTSRSSEWDNFFRVRTTELRKSLLDTNRFFCSSQNFVRRDNRGNRVLLDMMAMNLPSAPRLRLCFLVECIARVLTHATKRLCCYVCEERQTLIVPGMSIYESMACLSAWLCIEADPDGDFSVGLFKWLAIASRKRPSGETNPSKKADTAELFEGVSVVADHVHKLFLALKAFQKALRNRSTSDAQFSDGFSWARVFLGAEDTSSELLRLAALKVHCLQQVIPKEFHAKSFPDFPTSSAVEEDAAIPVKKRRRSEHRGRPPTKSRLKTLHRKSRNKVVDIFMNLDQGMSSPRRNFYQDAYADLEDFLVEG